MTTFIPPMINLPTGVEIVIHSEGHIAQCPNCCQQMLLRPITLSKAMVKILSTFKDGQMKKPKDIHDVGGRTAYANYTQLKYWKFIAEYDGYWKITNEGLNFLNGETIVPEILWVYNDHARIVPDYLQGKMIHVSKVERKDVSRETVIEESLLLDASGQENLL